MSLALVLYILPLLQFPIAHSTQYKVGDLDSWGVPPPTKSKIYSSWSQSHHFKVGDSLLFLYPPSQDSVVQVTEQAYDKCITSDPLMKFGDGNSLFNITTPGNFFFSSGEKGHCEKHQKIEIQVASADGKFFPPSGSGSDAPVGSPSSSFSNAFGPIPMGLGSGSGSGSGSGAAGKLVEGGFWGAVGSFVGGVILWGLF